MQDFQKRVIQEKKELVEKLLKLDSFLVGDVVGSLPEDEQLRLKKQYGIMMSYSNILRERIANFK